MIKVHLNLQKKIKKQVKNCIEICKSIFTAINVNKQVYYLRFEHTPSAETLFWHLNIEIRKLGLKIKR